MTITAGELYTNDSTPSGDVVINGGLLAMYGSYDQITGNITDTAAGTMYVGSDRIAVVGTINLTASDLEIEGGADLTATSVTVATAASIVAVNGSGEPREIIGPVTLNAGGTLDMSVDDEDFTITGDWTCTGSTITWHAAGRLIVAGNIVNASLATTLAGSKAIRMTGASKTLEWRDYDNAGRMALTIAAGATISSTTAIYCISFATEAASVYTASSSAVDVCYAGNNMVDIQGTYTGNLQLRSNWNLSSSNSGRVAASGDLTVLGTGASTITQSGEFSVGGLLLYGVGDGWTSTYILSGAAPVVGDTVLGVVTGAKNRGGILTFSGAGSATMGSLSGAASSTANEFNMGPRQITMASGAAWDGTDI